MANITPLPEDPQYRFQPATQAWFASAFTQATPAQQAAWSAIGAGDCTLVIAPTGSGKTLAAFLHAIDRLFRERENEPADARHTTTRVLYISPIKALGADVRRNLRLPLDGVSDIRRRRGDAAVTLTVGMRTGDTPAAERAVLQRRPPDILITTPESLYLMLTAKARETLRGVTTVIIDEIHAVAGTKRGAHLALSLERLDALLPAPAQRIGLSATVRPVERVADFLGGVRPVTVVNPTSSRTLEVTIAVPVEDMTDIPARDAPGPGSQAGGRAGSIWPHVEAAILERILACRATIVFANSRGLAEKLTARLNERYAERIAAAPPTPEPPLQYHSSAGGTGKRADGETPTLARSHHGSVSKEQRAAIESALKAGELRCVVATSSLELGIDMGLVDQVIQVGAPPSVASALQRVGRAGHHVGGVSAGVIYPRTRRDLVDAAVTVERMLAGRLEAVAPPRNPLDVLAQQTVAAVAMAPVQIDQWYALVRRADPFRALPRSAFDATLDMLAGRYPSEEFGEFRPRLVWDRRSGLLTARPGAQQLAVTSGGTIPDRGMFSVVLPEGEEQRGARRVGELDEEMVYESRVNDVITLGATSWRIQQITHDQVVVIPAPGRSARLPFWHGDNPGRPAELGEAIGAFLREVEAAAGSSHLTPADPLAVRLRAAGLDDNALNNLLTLVAAQREATSTLPTDRTLVVERCRDESGDWRVMLHSPYGQRVHAPWALAIAARIRQRLHVDPAVVASDDGITVRIPDSVGRVPGAELYVFDPLALRTIVTDAVGQSALFAARFRECAARALLLPRRRPGKRSPLWQQRLRAGQLLEIARSHDDFPLIIETARECLQDVYDLGALQGLMQRLHDGAVRLVEATTDVPSPFAANLLFGYVAEFMYQGDAPLAERRASVLSLDSGLLSELLEQGELGELLDPQVVAQVGEELQHTAPERRVKGVEGLADVLRELGPLTHAEIAARLVQERADEVDVALAQLAAAGRIIPVTLGAHRRWASVEDAARLRDGLGVALPPGVPAAFLQAVDAPVRDLLSRYARTHGPFTSAQAAAHFGLGVAIVNEQLGQLRDRGRLLPCNVAGAGEGDTGSRREWVWDEVFRRLRARSLQAAREATRAVPRAAFVRLMLERQGVVTDAAPATSLPTDGVTVGAYDGVDGLARVVEQLSGLALPASLWESQILPARVRDYQPAMLDELLAAGEVLWAGHGALGDGDGLVSLHWRELAGATLPLAALAASVAVTSPAGKVSDASVSASASAGKVSDASVAATPAAGKTLEASVAVTPAAGRAVNASVSASLHLALLDILADGGAYFVRQLTPLVQARLTADAVGEHAADVGPEDVAQALWTLAWQGRVSSDSWLPLRALTGAHTPSRARPTRASRHPRRQVPGWVPVWTPASAQAARSPWGAAALTGRWSLLAAEPVNSTLRLLTWVESLFDRYGVVSRGVAVAERVPNGFPALLPLLRRMEDAGRILRGRFVNGMGAAQFAEQDSIERLRELAAPASTLPAAVALSAYDPANPFGWLLSWPAHPSGIRPSRRGGAMVVICGGQLALYLAPSGRQLLTFLAFDEANIAGWLAASLRALATGLRREKGRGFTLETVDGRPAGAGPWGEALSNAGFSRVPKGYAWYG
ncbi:DEAD/DEAH box helicase [Sodalis praecaptivus]|uniref:DEAD/DEAH box helicase n=1 Tax=Sodalis praecaptivus TaxID=1239307 RepID=W0HYJ7_9GAMM|nr:ATP-dependent helicase [Sodalis praecaptivus]AHF77290.1 DEAD/DEAH box helicase [Sodalis praecaptivus]